MKTEAEKDWITKIYEVQAGDILFSESHRRYIAVHSIDADNYIYWECYELTPEWKNVLFSVKLQQYELAQGNYRKSKHLTSTETIAIWALISVLDSEWSSHENLLDALWKCVEARKRCKRNEFMDMLEEYKFMKKKI